jgi:hypothetical protein
MNEKRKEHRLKANIPVKLSFGNNDELVARTENISRLGTYVELPREVPAGKNIVITLELPAYTQDASLIGDVSCSGTVFRSNRVRLIDGSERWGTGIFFTDFQSLSDRQKVSFYVDHLIAKEEEEIKEGLKRRKAKETAHLSARQIEGAGRKQEAFQKEALGLLHDISSRLDAIERKLKVLKK